MRYVDILPVTQWRVAIVVGSVPHPKAGPFPAVLSSIDARLERPARDLFLWPDVSGDVVDHLATLADQGCERLRVVYPHLS